MSKLVWGFRIVVIGAGVALAILICLLSAQEAGVGSGVDISFGHSKCSAKAPVGITTTNRLPIPLEAHGVMVSAKRPGYSTVVRNGRIDSDRIIDGWSSLTECWPAPSGNEHLYETYEARDERERQEKKENPRLIWSAEPLRAKWADLL